MQRLCARRLACARVSRLRPSRTGFSLSGFCLHVYKAGDRLKPVLLAKLYDG